jgi:hypothetical protein
VQAVRVVPPHEPRQASRVPAQAARVPRGAPVTTVQRPALPYSPHASHCPVQALSQQMPSTQKLDVHSAAAWHWAPLAFFVRHTPVGSQFEPVGQGFVALHPPEHWVASAHRLLAHAIIAGALHEPLPVHTDAVVTVPAEQAPGLHWVSLWG